MTDAFDQWIQWAEKPWGDRRTIPADLYHSVVRLPPEDQFDREKVNAAAEQRQELVWIYEDGHKHIGDVDWIKVFATEEAASAWLAKNDPEGIAWAYPIEAET
ncbi:hypothetical protein ABIC03_003542 [Bradyrhizobium sp. RT6a]|uniref:hypothetical protein n=1 Tax=unclassified Bradyrhizobium TaxID=2631580 RepID=UPI003399EFD4